MVKEYVDGAFCPTEGPRGVIYPGMPKWGFYLSGVIAALVAAGIPLAIISFEPFLP